MIAVICFGVLLGFGCVLLILCDCPVYVVEYKGIRFHFLSKRKAEKEIAFLEKVREMEIKIAEIERQNEETKSLIEASKGRKENERFYKS